MSFEESCLLDYLPATPFSGYSSEILNRAMNGVQQRQNDEQLGMYAQANNSSGQSKIDLVTLFAYSRVVSHNIWRSVHRKNGFGGPLALSHWQRQSAELRTAPKETMPALFNMIPRCFEIFGEDREKKRSSECFQRRS